jgi:hypothetical protein
LVFGQAIIRGLTNFSVEVRKEKLKEYLSNDSNEFITFLRYIFRDVIS